MHVHSVRSTDELRHMAAHAYVPVMVDPDPRFQGRMTQYELGGALSLSQSRAGALRTFRTPRMAATGHLDETLMFCVHLAGTGWVRQHDRAAELSPGSGVLYETHGAWELTTSAAMRSLSLHLPRDLVPMRPAEITAACARTLSPRSPTMRLLAEYLDHLHRVFDELSADRRRDAGHAAVELLTMTLRDMAPSVPSTGGDVLLHMMTGHMRDHLADPALTVEELARRHHVSVRHAYAVFSRIDRTPGVFIREERLTAARAMLADPRYLTRPVAEIGAAVGWPELRTFERAFRRRYGMTPARWRRDHEAPR